MNLNKRIQLFSSLGDLLKNNSSEDFLNTIEKASQLNPWFTQNFIKKSFFALSILLDEQKLKTWVSNYEIEKIEKKDVLIIMAGNIPMVGFHDLLCVLICGHNAILKFSSKDSLLMKFIIDLLISLDSSLINRIKIVDDIVKCKFDAIIATGSDNSSNYFNYYFKDYKSIIRKNRRSIAILNGYETDEHLKLLSRDIFMYFGLGCRNVSKLYVTINFDIDRLFKAFYSFKDLINHTKYANNYDYNKTVYLMNSEKIIDNGFVLLKEDISIQSPVATLFYEYYKDKNDLYNYIEENRFLFQCIVDGEEVDYGQTQFPGLDDYSDKKDTIEFLSNI